MIADYLPDMCGDSVGSPSSLGRTTVLLSLYVEDADRFFDTAQTAGATVHMPLMDAFWGDRYGQLKDPYGHIWEIATHKKDMSKDDRIDSGSKRGICSNVQKQVESIGSRHLITMYI